MARSVFKYHLKVGHVNVLHMPAGAVVTKVDYQPRDLGTQDLCLWAEVSDGMPSVERRFRFYATGEHIQNDEARFIATVQTPHGYRPLLVWHLYEE